MDGQHTFLMSVTAKSLKCIYTHNSQTVISYKKKQTNHYTVNIQIFLAK